MWRKSYVHMGPGAPNGQKRALDALGLESWAIANHPYLGCLQKPHVLSTAEASLQPLLCNLEPWPWDRQAPNTHIVPHDFIYGRRIEQLTSASVSPHLRGDP